MNYVVCDTFLHLPYENKKVLWSSLQRRPFKFLVKILMQKKEWDTVHKNEDLFVSLGCVVLLQFCR